MPRYFDTFRSHQPRFHKHTEVLLQNQSESDAGLLALSESKVQRSDSGLDCQPGQNPTELGGSVLVGLVVFHRTEE